MPMITPNEAAKRSSRSRRTVMRAIAKGALAARRTNDGWAIEETDLAAWAAAHAPADAHAQPDAHPSPALLDERIRGLEALLDTMRHERDDLKQDRDAWRAMAQRPWWKKLAG